MQKAVENLVLDLDTVKIYKASPTSFAASTQGLQPHAKEIRASGRSDVIDYFMCK